MDNDNHPESPVNDQSSIHPKKLQTLVAHKLPPTQSITNSSSKNTDKKKRWEKERIKEFI